jgi:hypothetical protein
MALQFSLAGDALANNTVSGTSFQSATTPITISVWINAPWTGGGGAQSYVGLYGEQQRIANGTTTAIQFGSRAANSFNVWTWGGGALVNSTISMTPYVNQWAFVAYTYDGTTHRCYVNGVAGGTSTNAQIAGTFDRVYLNGYTNGAAAETSSFQLDTYSYYNRALSADEILTMYTIQGHRHGILYNSVCRYEFSEGAIGSNVSSVPNLTNYNATYSNLIPIVPAGTSRVTLLAGYASANIRPGI